MNDEADVQHRPTALQASLPRSAYRDESVFAAEQEHLIARSWFCIGREDAIGAAPGSYQLFDVGAERVLVVRGNDGTLCAFANTCAHRGTELVDSADERSASGCFNGLIRCPYHFWSYELDGSLRAAPWVDLADLGEVRLNTFDVATWGGFAFVRLEGSGPDLLETLGPIAQRLANFPLDELVVGASITYEVGANWKVMMENYNECYHCGPVHPELCDLVPTFRMKGGSEITWNDGVPHRDGADTYTVTGTSTRASFPGLTAEQATRHFGELIYPNLLLSVSREHAAAFVITPRSATSTTIVCQFLFHPNEVASPAFDPSDAVDFWDTVNRQDWHICERVQRGMASRTFRQGWYAPMEDESLDIRRWWSASMPEP